MHPDRAARPLKTLRAAASTYFFPAASLYAALVLPASVLAITGIANGPAALATPFGHAHEMLVGYALAVVAGNQLGVLPAPRLRLLLTVWIVARVAFVALPSPVASVFDISFVAALGLHVAPRLFQAAKKLRNQALPALLTALCAAAIAFDLATFLAGTATVHAIVTERDGQNAADAGAPQFCERAKARVGDGIDRARDGVPRCRRDGPWAHRRTARCRGRMLVGRVPRADVDPDRRLVRVRQAPDKRTRDPGIMTMGAGQATQRHTRGHDIQAPPAQAIANAWLTRGITSRAINSIERRANSGSTQS